MHVHQWIEKFPEARAVFPGHRGFDKHPPGTFKDDTIILDRHNPKLPDEVSDIVLLPWTGYLQLPGFSTRAEENGYRSEVEVYHKPSKLLFMFDPIVGTTNSLPGIIGWGYTKAMGCLYDEKNDPNHAKPLPYRRNFGLISGFRIGDESLAHQSAVRLVDINAETLLLSHGVPEKGALILSNQSEVRRILEVCLEPLLKLVPTTPSASQ